MTPSDHAKQAAVEQWSAEPDGEAGGSDLALTKADVELLIRSSEQEAPWLDRTLGISDARGRRVLDVGCGGGVLLARLGLAGAEATGVDLVAAQVASARARLVALGVSARVLVGDAERLPFSGGSFDRVVSNNALQFTPDIRAALREARRVLRPGGEARLVVYHRGSAYFWWYFVVVRGLLGGELIRRSPGSIVGRNIPWARHGDLAARAFTRRRLRRLMADAGFEDVRTVVRGFSWDHVVGGGALVRRIPLLRSRRAEDAIGRLLGWYLVGRGVSPGGS